MFVAAEHIRKYDNESVAPCLMGSSIALGALARGEIHVAGVHLADEQSDDWKLSDMTQQLGTLDCKVVTFAHWEEGLLVAPGNRKKIRAIADLARPTVRIVNREPGSGARRLLDRELKAAGIPPSRIKGYGDEVLSHLVVAARIKAGLADSGIGVRARGVHLRSRFCAAAARAIRSRDSQIALRIAPRFENSARPDRRQTVSR